MPTLNGVPFTPIPKDWATLNGRDVYLLRATGEATSDYSIYIQLQRRNRSRQWGSVFEPKKNNLTFEQACRAEASARSLLQQFPKTLEGPALQLLHHGVLSLDAAAQAVMDLQAAAEATGRPQQASVVLGAAPRTKLPKAAVILWLSQVAEQLEHQGGRILWRVRPDLQLRFQLPAEIPRDVADALSKPVAVSPRVLKGKRTSGPHSTAERKRYRVTTSSARARAWACTGGSGADDFVYDEAAERDDEDDKAASGASSAHGSSDSEEESGGEGEAHHDSAAQLQSATCKAMAIAALRSAGPEGMGLKAVLDAAPGPGGGLLDNCLPRTMQTVLTTDGTFLEVSQGLYVLRCPEEHAPTDAPAAEEAGPGSKDFQREGSEAGSGQSETRSPGAERAAKVRAAAAAAKQELLARQQERQQAEETLTRLAGRVNQWNAAVAPQPGEPSAGERPADSGPEGHRAQLDRATQAVEACRAAEKAAAELEKAQHMELEGLESGNSADDYEERLLQLRKAEAKKFPADDLDVLASAQQRAASRAGIKAPAKDVLLPTFLEEQESARLVDLLYVADFLTQFGRVLGIQALSLVQLQQLLGLQSIKAALELQQRPRGSPSPAPAQAGAVARHHKQEPGSSPAPAGGKQGSEAPPQGRAGSQSPALPGAATRQQDQAPSSSPAPEGERQEPHAPQKAAIKAEADAEPMKGAAGHRARQPMPELENGESSSGRHTGSTKTELLDSECTDVPHVKLDSTQQAQAGLPRQHLNGFAQHACIVATHHQRQRTLKLEHAVRAAVGVHEGSGLLHEDSSRASPKQEPGQAGKPMSGPGEGRLAPTAEGRQSPVVLDSPADEGRMVPVHHPSAAERGESAVQLMHPPAVEGRQSPAQQLHLPAAERKQSPVQQLHEAAAEGRQSPVQELNLPAAEGRQAPQMQKQHHGPAGDSLQQQPPSIEVRPAADEKGACPQPQWLWKVYQGLLSHLLPLNSKQQPPVNPIELRWSYLNVEGVWPEVLRRYIMSRAGPSAPRLLVSEAVQDACQRLGQQSVTSLSADEHLVLLRYMCDEILDQEVMRGLFQERLDGEANPKAPAPKEAATNKRKLKATAPDEAEDGESSKKRPKSAAGAAKRDARKGRPAAAAQRNMRSSGRRGSAACGAAGKEASAAGGGEDAEMEGLESRAASGLDSAEGSEPPEPSWELPPELQEFSGNKGDRHALLLFKQQQQAARGQIDAERATWQAAQRRRAKVDQQRRRQQQAEASAARAAEEAERAREHANWRRESSDPTLERFAVRRAPLGWDRHHRSYWWGFGGKRDVVWVMGGEGQVGVWTQPAQLSSLRQSLDKRGVREAGLMQSLNAANMRAIVGCMQPQGEDVAKTEQPSPAPAALDGVGTQLLEGVEGAAISGAMASLSAIAEYSERAGILGPPGGWQALAATVQAARRGQLPEADLDGEGSYQEEVCRLLRNWLLKAEICIYNASGQPNDPNEPEPEPAVVAVPRPSLAKEMPKVRRGDRCGYCHTCLNPHLKKPCRTRREEMLVQAGASHSIIKASASAEQEAAADEERQSGGEMWEVAEPLGGAAAGKYGKIWRHRRERELWRNDVTSSLSAARLAYCAMTAQDLFAPVIDHLNPDVEVKRPKTKKKKR